jgi:glucosamine--fructose-6-phosphate aminotransferase (isomerizing)
MCSVVGYVGSEKSHPKVLQGLERLEYRGYDSAGFACLQPETNIIACVKAVGGIQNLLSQSTAIPFEGRIGIGHTRWSTHGTPTTENAHPQVDCNTTIALVHNGIIENHSALRQELEATGHTFISQTDTEVIAHLLEDLLQQETDLKKVLLALVARLEGAYALVIILSCQPDTLISIRRRSPLCIGISSHGTYVASDAFAFAGEVERVIYMPDESCALVSSDSVNLFDFSGNALLVTPQETTATAALATKQGYAHYMLKEIYEQKKVIFETVHALRTTGLASLESLGITEQEAKDLAHIVFVGCGTSYNAGALAELFFEEVSGIRARAELASEYKFRRLDTAPHGLYLGISQSGETADTLEVLRLFNREKLPTAVISNVANSSMVREATGYLLTHAGQEIAVASTKSFSAQVTVLYWLAHVIACAKGLLSLEHIRRAEDELLAVAEILENSIETYKHEIQTVHAPRYASYKKAIFLGRHVSYPFAREAALKLKEISYLFTDSYPAGELKHGPIALIDAETPVFLFSVVDDAIYQKLVANAQEIKARSGHLVVFAFEWQQELIALADTVFLFPRVNPLLAPLAMTGLMQYFVYQIALELERPIDKPRNLAKSVTVE